MVHREFDLCLNYLNKQMDKTANKHSFAHHGYHDTMVMKSDQQTFEYVLKEKENKWHEPLCSRIL